MRLLLATLMLLLWASLASAAGEDRTVTADIMWQIRPPEFIAHLAVTLGFRPRRRGLAWWGPEFCIIMTPTPPVETAPEIVIRRWLADLNHERRHCREKRNFHR